MSQLKIVKNAFANICRISVGALVSLFIPPLLIKILSKDTYSTWLLILHLSAYVSFLEFGIQMAVGRYVAHHNELREFSQRDNIVSTALAILAGLSLIAIICSVMLAVQLPHLFLGMPVELQQDAQLALLCVGSSLAIALPFSVFGGIFIGLQRYDVPAWILGISRLLGGGLIIFVAHTSHNIVMMAVTIAISNIGAGLCQFLSARQVASDIKISIHGISKSTGIKITAYCLSLTVWTTGMLLVSGMDMVIVGYFDYRSVIYYSLAAGLTNFLLSIHTAIFGVIMPHASVIGAKKDRQALGDLLIVTTRYGAIILIMTGLPLIFGAKLFLTLWVGSSYADQTTLLLQLMIIANCIRHLGAPYANIVLALGAQKQVILSPIAEGLVNITISIILTAYYGIIGVVVGTLCGAVVSLCVHHNHSLKRTSEIKIKEKRLLVYAAVRPVLSAIPALVCWLICQQMNLPSNLELISLISVIIISYLFLWNYAIFDTERAILITIICSKSKLFNPIKNR
jgi:O-antigen/teichoic acid export membrane protein